VNEWNALGKVCQVAVLQLWALVVTYNVFGETLNPTLLLNL